MGQEEKNKLARIRGKAEDLEKGNKEGVYQPLQYYKTDSKYFIPST